MEKEHSGADQRLQLYNMICPRPKKLSHEGMETARQRAFYLYGSFLQMLIAAFCLPALPAERNREKEWTQIGYKLCGMFVKGPFLNTVPGVKAGQWSLLWNELCFILSLYTGLNAWGRVLQGKLEGKGSVLNGRWCHKQIFLFKEHFKTVCWEL